MNPEYKGRFFSAIRTSDFYGNVKATVKDNKIIVDFECEGDIAHGKTFHAELNKDDDNAKFVGDFNIDIHERSEDMISGIYHDKEKIDCGMFQVFLSV